MKPTVRVVIILCLFGAAHWQLRAASQIPAWGSGVAPFAFALIGDMPYGAIREAPFARLVAEINRDNDVDFVMHAGDIKAGSERCDDSLIQHRFDLYQTFQRAFVFTPGDNEWTDCHRVNNGQYNPLERLAFVRSVFFPQVGHTTGGQVRPVRSQAEGSAYPEFVENVMFTKQSVMFATVHVVGSNNDLEPWAGHLSCRQLRFAAGRSHRRIRTASGSHAGVAGRGLRGRGRHEGAVPVDPGKPLQSPSNPALCPGGFQAFLARLETRAQQYGRPVILAHGDDHFFVR